MKGPSFLVSTEARERFAWANQHKSELMSYSELRLQAENMGIVLPDIENMTVFEVERDAGRTLFQRIVDFITCNRQRFGFSTNGKSRNVSVISAHGNAYQAGRMNGCDILVAVDVYSKKGAIRQRDIARYKQVVQRLRRDLKLYHRNAAELRRRYEQSCDELTSIGFWTDYLGLK